ncbi:MAG: HEPN domain-containing protein [Clostridiales bacterium]|nr:HEPN domain-containing protein [Clostridiales bacterium]
MDTDYILEWFHYADMDLLSAQGAAARYPVHLQLVCFLCQQSVEKNLKGFLLYHEGTEPPRIHNLDFLCGKCAVIDPSFNEIYDQCEVLSTYSVLPRYPRELFVEEHHMKKALVYAQEIKDFAPLQAVRRALEQKT